MVEEEIKFDYDSTHNCAVLTASNKLFGLIRETFSVEDRAAKAKRRFSGRNIPTRKYIITPTGRFDIGMTGEIVSLLKRRGVKFHITGTQAFKERLDTRFDFMKKRTSVPEIEELYLKLRPYQREGVENALKYGSGVFLFPTSSGKTLLMATTIQNILKNDRKAKILVVTLTHLVPQFVSDFVSYGMDPSIISPWTGETGFVENRIVVAGSVMVASQCIDCDKEIPKLRLAIRRSEKAMSSDIMDRKTMDSLEKIHDGAVRDLERCEGKMELNRKVRKYFKSVNVLMVDEVHQLKKGNSITDISDFVKTNHRFGYTGTMPESKIDEWTVIGKIGPVRQIVDRSELVENKSISEVCVQFLKMHYIDKPDYLPPEKRTGYEGQLLDFRKEADFLYSNSFRNETIANIAIKFNKNILVIVDRIEHGEYLRDMIAKKAGGTKEVFFISGEMSPEERESIRVMMEERDNVVCIAIAKIFSTGVNIKNIYGAIFAFVCKAKVSLVQTVGRCVRMRDGKVMAFIFDFHDCLKYSERHHVLREKIYNAEGFIMREKEITES